VWQRDEITGYQIGTFPGAEVYLCPDCAEAYVEEQSEGQSKLKDWVEYHLAFPIRSEDIWDEPLKCQRCGKAIKVILDDRGRRRFIMQCPTREEAIAQYGAVGAYWFQDAMKDPALKQLAREIKEERQKWAREGISDIRKAIESLRRAKSTLPQGRETGRKAYYSNSNLKR
jgi:hypothetical protein